MRSLRLSINIEQTCVSCGYDSNFIAHERTNVNLKDHKKEVTHIFYQNSKTVDNKNGWMVESVC